jgi:hypothetical protein
MLLNLHLQRTFEEEYYDEKHGPTILIPEKTTSRSGCCHALFMHNTMLLASHYVGVKFCSCTSAVSRTVLAA